MSLDVLSSCSDGHLALYWRCSFFRIFHSDGCLSPMDLEGEPLSSWSSIEVWRPLSPLCKSHSFEYRLIRLYRPCRVCHPLVSWQIWYWLTATLSKATLVLVLVISVYMKIFRTRWPSSSWSSLNCPVLSCTLAAHSLAIINASIHQSLPQAAPGVPAYSIKDPQASNPSTLQQLQPLNLWHFLHLVMASPPARFPPLVGLIPCLVTVILSLSHSLVIYLLFLSMYRGARAWLVSSSELQNTEHYLSNIFPTIANMVPFRMQTREVNPAGILVHQGLVLSWNRVRARCERVILLKPKITALLETLQGIPSLRVKGKFLKWLKIIAWFAHHTPWPFWSHLPLPPLTLSSGTA